MEVAMGSQHDALDNFVNFLFEGLEGYAYLAAKEPKDEGKWLQEFFHYPNDVDKLKQTIRSATASHEIYLAPALYNENVLTHHNPAVRENVKVSNVVWTEFDGNAPEWDDFAGPPSLIVQSSIEGHHHVYWKLNEPLTDIDLLEDINRRVVYNFGADNSAWDATQVLRPPLTRNHKRSTGVHVLDDTAHSYDVSLFDSLVPAPKPEEVQWELGEVPTAVSVVEKYDFPPDLQLLLEKPVSEIPDRSAALMNLAYGCCEMGMKDVEVLAMLLAFDDVLGKFKNRKNRNKYLSNIIVRARQKHPYEEPEAPPVGESLFIWDYKTFLEAEIEIDWVLEGMLMEQGNMLMAGPSGVGKTQLSLQAMAHVAMGKNFLHYNVPKPKKILFLSLEMGHAELQIFMQKQDLDRTEAEREILAENLRIIALGESWPLNKREGQDRLEEVIAAVEPEGIFIDSVGSSVIGNISSSEVVQPLTNFNDHIRNKYKTFLWYIHHTRKAQQGQVISGADDIYGDQYLNNRATSSYLVLPAKNNNIRIRNPKQRLAPKEDDYILERTPNLGFNKVTQVVDDQLKHQLDNLKDDNEQAGPFQL